MRTCLLLLFTSLAWPLLAQTKHPFTFEDMMALKRVEEPVVSPDGKWVLFAAVDVDLKANTRTPHVWWCRFGPLKATLGCPMSRRFCETWGTYQTEKQVPPLRRIIRKRMILLRSE